MTKVAGGIWSVGKSSFVEFLNDLIGSGQVHHPGSNAVPTADCLVAGDLDQRYDLGVTRLKTDCCACRDVQSIAICFDAVELELGITLDEVIM